MHFAIQMKVQIIMKRQADDMCDKYTSMHDCSEVVSAQNEKVIIFKRHSSGAFFTIYAEKFFLLLNLQIVHFPRA
jgi:hypothetical protein